MSVMLYKCPGKHKLHGVDCEYVIVSEVEVADKMAEGWHKSPADAASGDKPKKRGRKPKSEE